MKVWVKICGVTRAIDAVAAVDAGADAIGLNFWQGSKRYCSPERAASIVASVPETTVVYGVFVCAGRERITEVIRQTGIRGIQFHGNEPLEDLMGWMLPVIRAVRVQSHQTVADALSEACGHRVLLDHPVGGGSGRRFDSTMVDGLDLSEVVVAGGLTVESVAEVVNELRPYGVDTAGGVEERPGIKDPRLIQEFVRHAKAAR